LKSEIIELGIETIEIKNNNGIQAIRIPPGMKIDDKVYLKKVGNVIYIIPYHNPWQNLIESIDLFTPDFMENREQPMPQTSFR
jgi:antitoxin VapB